MYELFCGFPGYRPVPPGWFKIVCWFYVMNTQRLTESGFMEKPGIDYVRNLLTVWTVQSSNNNVHTYNPSLLKLGPIASLTLKNELGTPIKLSCVSFGTRNNL